MKILYYDCFCGISGDMNLGAMVDAGVDGDYLIRELSKLPLDGEYKINIKKGMKKGITGTKVDVILTHGGHGDNDSHEIYDHHDEHNHYHDDGHNHKHDHHDEHNHHHDDGHNHKHDHHDEHNHHHHRNLKDIEDIINRSTLNDRVKKSSINMFKRIAEAEGKVHGKPAWEVHFHEVGAVDSIIDIVGAAITLDYLNIDKVMASTVQVGGGFVNCAHGIIPVPAPATVEILKNIPVKSGIVPFETTTPTGAAIVAENAAEFTDKMDFSIDKIGYGLGNRELDIPNVLRVYLGEKKDRESIEEQYIIEANIDDMNPEFYSFVEERLFEAGALDVFTAPVIMKKGRPAVKLSILTDKTREHDVVDIIFRETTSIGVRKFKVEKIMLKRDVSTLHTRYGDVRIKKSYYKGEMVKYKAEYEDCKRVAIENNIPIAGVYREIYKIMDRDFRDFRDL
ncbi:MAG: nickel pincer cofactor biosynthesis protein LarC [Candidatus Eremiobacterota bacterium]